MQDYIYVIVGGGLAGGSAIDAIRERDPKGSLALITQESHRPYQRPPLSKRYLLGETGLDTVYLHTQVDYIRKNVDLYLDSRVTTLIPGTRYVILDGGRQLQYSKLLLATGGRAKRLPFPGNNLEKVFTLRTIEDSQAIRDNAGKGKHALVLGGSFIGSEVASSLAQLGTQVTMAFPESRLLERVVPEEMSAHLHELYNENGVRILPGTIVERLEGHLEVKKAVLDNGETLDVDLVVMGVGIDLNTDLTFEEELDLNEEGAILVDETLCTSDPNIYAAGDIAAWPDPTFDRRMRVEHWDVAKSQGRCAGINMTGEFEAYTRLPYFFSDLFDLSVEVWGDLSQWDRTALRGTMEDGGFAYFYFDQDRLTGVLSAGRPAQERLPMQALVKERPSYRMIADTLTDPQAGITQLIEDEPRDDHQTTGAEKEQAMSDLSFEQDIAPLFRKKDIEEMKSISDFDLSKYEDVKPRAESIYARIADESMPCDQPWPAERKNKFRQWIDQGMKP